MNIFRKKKYDGAIFFTLSVQDVTKHNPSGYRYHFIIKKNSNNNIHY